MADGFDVLSILSLDFDRAQSRSGRVNSANQKDIHSGELGVLSAQSERAVQAFFPNQKSEIRRAGEE
jgi:hypothetical protein